MVAPPRQNRDAPVRSSGQIEGHLPAAPTENPAAPAAALVSVGRGPVDTSPEQARGTGDVAALEARRNTDQTRALDSGRLADKERRDDHATSAGDPDAARERDDRNRTYVDHQGWAGRAQASQQQLAAAYLVSLHGASGAPRGRSAGLPGRRSVRRQLVLGH
jgi:hypothetical protein